MFTAAGCHLPGADSGADELPMLNASIEEITKGSFTLPLHEDYPLVYAFVRKPPVELDNEPYYITLWYRYKGRDISYSTRLVYIILFL